MTRPAADSVRVSWTGTGTGTISLGSAVTGFQAFPSDLDGRVVSYAVEHENGSERENGIGTYTLSGNTLSRDLVTFSTAGAPTKVTFTSGTKNVRLSLLALDFVENRATVDPGINDDITAGYIEGRSRWLNTATVQLFYCASHAAGAAVWQRTAALPTVGTAFSSGRAAANTDQNKRLRWQGTSAGRLDVPTGLLVGTDFEVVIDHDLASIAPLTIERTSGDGNIRLGNPIGCRVLRPGGIARVRIVEDGVYITGDLDPATMAEPGAAGSPTDSGMSILLERGLLQTVTGGVLQSWGDGYGLKTFSLSTGSPGIGDAGQMTVAAGLDADTSLVASASSYAGTSLLFGYSLRIDAASSSINSMTGAASFSAGRGIYLAKASSDLNVNVMRDASTLSALNAAIRLGYPMAGGVAVNRTAGYAYGFFDEGYADREREEVVTGLTFVVDWTAATVVPTVGTALGASESFTGEFYAWTIRDNVGNFATANDARDQAHAMLAEMRGYYV